MSTKQVKNVVIRVSEEDRKKINTLALQLSAAANTPIAAGAVFARMMEVYSDVLQREGLDAEAKRISGADGNELG